MTIRIIVLLAMFCSLTISAVTLVGCGGNDNYPAFVKNFPETAEEEEEEEHGHEHFQTGFMQLMNAQGEISLPVENCEVRFTGNSRVDLTCFLGEEE